MRKILCALVLLAFATPLLASDPFVGTWTLNSAKTKYTTGTAPKNVTLVIEEQGDSLQVTGTGTTGDGSPISVKYTVPIKGGAGTVQQGDFDGVSSKLVSSHSRINTFTKGGKEIRKRHTVVSSDGKTLSTTVKGVGWDGKPTAGLDVYDKQ
ncbi:hypothetical protein RBB79_16875 [Tunturiibacter empetritectus]|uniref:Lipocalin-like domain-containing protein n=1 Tax=Tunturiibacter lichenicola TaxID=2051959 RepID=A0A852VEK9_9BACT|nr:hypothetical protein [Edaphobacter lichenicola]NYF91298.1 hypothetical protein [Edaphobacter lichenicola]